jgi:uncharacterized membrane protein
MILMMISTPYVALAQRRSQSHDLTNPASLGEMVAVHNQQIQDNHEDIMEIRRSLEKLNLAERLTKIEDFVRESAAASDRNARLLYTILGSLIAFFITQGWHALNKRRRSSDA